jgi:hypothetical protein
MKTLITLALLLPIAACSAEKGNKQCAAYLSTIKPQSGHIIDLAQLGGYPQESPIEAALQKKKIKTPCRPLRDAPGSFEIASGKASRPWVLFVSKSTAQHQGETLEGVSGSLVLYDSKGVPVQQMEAARLLSHEGFALSRTGRVMLNAIETCDQEAEFFEYSEAGDITGILENPSRTACVTKNVPIR